jgi:polysaccharide biosynthesis transport protein
MNDDLNLDRQDATRRELSPSAIYNIAPAQILHGLPLATKPAGPSQPNGLLEYWRMASSHKGILIAFAFAGALGGFLIGLPKTPLYRARTSLEVLELNEDFMNMKQTNPLTTTDYSYDTSESQTQVKVLESDALLKRTIRDLHGDDKASGARVHSPEPAWRELLHMPASDQVSHRQRQLNEAAASRNVRVTPRTRILELTIDSADPKLAADFANTLANEYIEESQDTRSRSSQKTSEWLGTELNNTRLKLEKSEIALQQYAQSSGLIFTDPQTNIADQKLQQIQGELSAATADRITKQSRFELAQSAPPDSLPDVLDNSALRQAAAKLSELRAELANLRATYSVEYNKTKKVEAEIATLQAAFEASRSNILARITNDYQEATRKERLLSSTYDTQARVVVGQSEKAIQYNILKREADSNRQLYDTMLQHLKESTVASALRTSNVRVLDEAEVPTVPFSPNFKVNTILGFVLGLISGTGYVLLRQYGNRRLQGPGDLHFWTGLPELGAIPRVNVPVTKKRFGDGLRDVTVSRGPGFMADWAAADLKGYPQWQRKPNAVAEALRRVLASLLFRGSNDSFPKVLVFTSTSSGEGKSTIVSNVGIALAEIGRKVLIIDGDLRRSSVHVIFGREKRGLSDLLRDSEENELAASSFIQSTAIPRLSLLASGEEELGTDILYSPKLRKLLAELTNSYDAILIDTPPMLDVTDARLLARLADGVILIARANRTMRDAVIAASRLLGSDRSRIVGCILNDWNGKQSSRPGYYGYPNASYEQGKEIFRAGATA